MNRRESDSVIRLRVADRRLLAELASLLGGKSRGDSLTHALVVAVRQARDDLHKAPSAEEKE